MELNKEVKREFDLFDKKTDALQHLRESAFSSFNKLGFPTVKNEEWKYTNVIGSFNKALNFRNLNKSNQLKKDDVNSFRVGGNNVSVIVFENGKYNPSCSDKFPESSNLIISNLSDKTDSPLVKQNLGKIAPVEHESFVALNTAFANDGILIHVKANTKIDKPVHLMFVNTSENSSDVTTLRNLIVAEKGAEITIIESYHNTKDIGSGITNSVTEFIVKESAHVELVKAQLESDEQTHINFTQVVQERNSTFDAVTLTLGGKLVRNNLNIKLNNENCTSHLFGLYIANKTQHIDNHTLVDHAMPNCYSNELYKGIIDGKASGVFNGKIFVRKDAQKTNAYQSNKNILLSDDAQMNTKPQLEIFADDVKCTHGATTGQLDEDALFYLRARGIGEKNARTLLNIAFAADVLNNIKSEELKQNLQQLTEQKLLGSL